MMYLPGDEPVINPLNSHLFHDPIVDGTRMGHGLVPRDFLAEPFGSIPGIPASAVQKIPRTRWGEIIKERTEQKALMSDLRDRSGPGRTRIPSLNQAQEPYCWSHSTISGALLTRAKEGQPFADLSAYAAACIIKNYRSSGGWNGESVRFLKERGCPTTATWPARSKDRANDNPRTWEEAALYKLLEDTNDIDNNDFDMLFTHLLLGDVCPLDLNWWRHSVLACDPVDGVSMWGFFREDSGKLPSLQEFNRIWEVDVGGGFAVRIWNSWADSWGKYGMGILTESKARPNGAIALRVMRTAA